MVANCPFDVDDFVTICLKLTNCLQDIIKYDKNIKMRDHIEMQYSGFGPS